MFHWLMRWIVFGPFLRARVHAEVIGRQYLPRRGPYLLAIGSHKTEVESGVLSVYLRSSALHFYAKAEYWRKGRFLAWFMSAIKQIPMDRNDPAKADDAIRAGAELLRRGKVVAVYPEGTRSPDDMVHGGYPSFVMSVIQAGGTVPVIPVGLIGFEAVSPSGSGLVPQRAEVKIVIGKPITLTRAELRIIQGIRLDRDDAETRIASRLRKAAAAPIARRISDETMQSIAQLCGKTYVKKRLPIPR